MHPTKPYTKVGDVQRFNQRYTAFARANWDETCLAHKKRLRSIQEITEAGKAGYTVEDSALHVGSRAMTGQIGRYLQEVSEEDTEKKRYDPADPRAFTRRLKHAARLYGAAIVGITRVNPLWVYACNGQEQPIELPEGIDTAVVIAVAMDYETTQTSPSIMASASTGNGYSAMDFTAVCVAKYLAELGWQAIPSGNDTALSIPLAIDAGLGELGRNGLLITEFYGPRVRLCKVFTDAPLVPDKPVIFGVKEFCDVCMKCADTCPSRSITWEEMTSSGPTPSNNPGVLKWYIHPDKCLAFWRVNGTGCANCIRSCPFNKLPGKIHDGARALIKLRSRPINQALVKLDDLCGYGKRKDVEEVLDRMSN